MIGRFRDPPRLTEDPPGTSDGLGLLIEKVRREAPDPETAAGLFARVEARIDGAVPEATSSSGPPPRPVGRSAGTGGSAGMNAAIVVGVAGAIMIAVVWGRAPARQAQVSVERPIASPKSVAAPVPVVEQLPLPTPPADIAAPPPLPARSDAERQRTKRPSRPESGDQHGMEVPGSSEAELLRTAQDALASSPAKALQIAEEHARRYPSGTFVQEREVIAIEALVRLGRMDAARVRAKKLLIAHPGTAHHARIEALLDEGW